MSAAREKPSKRFRTDFQSDGHKEEELFIWDVSNVWDPSPTPKWVSLATMSIGTTPTSRIGDCIHVRRIEVQMTYGPRYAKQGNTYQPTMVRAILFVDKQQNGVTPAATDGKEILNYAGGAGDGSIQLPHNPMTVPSRYEILNDEMFVLPPVRGLDSGTIMAGTSIEDPVPIYYNTIANAPVNQTAVYVAWPAHKENKLDWWKKNVSIDTNIEVGFSNPNATNNPITNGIQLMLEADADTDWRVTYTTRIYYTNRMM